MFPGTAVSMGNQPDMEDDMNAEDTTQSHPKARQANHPIAQDG